MLAKKEPRRPKQASLRRSISASYYALFHFLTYEATRQLLGASRARQPMRHLFARAFEHGEVLGVCKSFRAGAGALPRSVQDVLGEDFEISDELQEVADSFVQLQRERHIADYDLSASYLRRDALEKHELARRSMQDLWPEARGQEDARVFCFAMVSWKRIRGR